MTLSTLYKIKTILEAEIDDSITDFLSCKDISLQNSISEYYLNDCLQSLFEVYDEILAQDNSTLTNDCLSTLKKEYLIKLSNFSNKKVS